MQGARAVMLRNKIRYPFGQSNFLRQSQPIGDMAGDYFCALQWLEMIVWIVTTLVLDKVIRRRDFSYVVVQRSDPAEHGICADSSARVFSQLADRVRMLVGSGRAQGKLTQNRQICVSQLQQSNIREHAKQRFINGYATGRKNNCQHAAAESKQTSNQDREET